MTATLHKITAGDGYEYYTRHVAAHDAEERGGGSLGDYYSARGESPGRWAGAGLAGLRVPPYRSTEIGSSVVAEGEPVSGEQMKSLFGIGEHPNAARIVQDVATAAMVFGGETRRQGLDKGRRAAALGDRFRVFAPSPFRVRCAKEFAAFNRARGEHPLAPIAEHDRAAIRTAVARGMFIEQFAREPLNERELSGWVARHGRQTTTAVAGFDWTFSPVKSVSVLWALAPRPVSDKVADAHRAAVADALAFLESHAAFTRRGHNGAAQLEVEGLIAAVFEHRDSRAGDPDLHTHLVVSNKVKTRVDGVWRTLDGAMFYRAAVTASEVYNTRLELHLHQLLGVRFAERDDPAAPGRRTVREIIGVDVELARHWSRRRAQVADRVAELSIAFQQAHGREPNPVETYALNQQAVLDTRGAKRARTQADQRRAWREQALYILGGRAALTRMLADALAARPGPTETPGQRWIERCADTVIATVAAERSSWRASHVRSEVERRIRDHVTAENWQQIAEAVTAAALHPSRSIARGDPDIADEPQLRSPPELFTRSDGTSIYRAVDGLVFTSPAVLDLEARLMEMARLPGGRTVAEHVIDAAIAAHNTAPANRGRHLNEGQIAQLRAFATSGWRIQFGNAPAGTGKTTAMRVLVDAWRADGGTVLGLAPTARAARVLEAETGMRVATVDKLLDVLARHTPTPQRQAEAGPDHRPPALPQWVLDIGADTLVIIDEHMQIGDLSRLRMLNYLLLRGATIRKIGDDKQLRAIAAAGAASDMMHLAPPVTLTRVVRFADPAEADASLMLRDGDPAGLGFHLDRDRIHIGAPAATVDAAFTAWQADYDAGLDTLMLAPNHALVTELNTLARNQRLSREGLPEHEVVLADDQPAGAGDIVRTTLNAPHLRIGASTDPVAVEGTDYVRNGYQWRVDIVHDDGSITLTQLLAGRTPGEKVHLPADYVTAHTRLGYAATIDSSQGATSDTCHVALTGSETRNQLYVALTRGRRANHLYLATALDPALEQSLLSDRAALPRTAVDILAQILARDGTAVSAHTDLRRALDPHIRLGHAVDIYLDALDQATDHHLGDEELYRLDTAAEKIWPGLTALRGYPGLRRHLAMRSLTGGDPIAALQHAITARELATAHDVCAVLNWRLDPTGTHSSPPGPLPWLPGLPPALAADPALGPYLSARARIITALAAQIRDAAATFTPAGAPLWARPLVGADPALLGDLAVWRAALHIPDTDLTPQGPARHTAPERRFHEHLTTRVTEAIGDTNLAVNVWSAAAKRIDARVLDDPFWPVLADRLDTAARAGIAIDTLLTAAATKPLPDTMTAAALWFRLHLDLDALHTSPGTALAPHWAADLRTVLGNELAERVLTDPAWPRIVTALERATTDAGLRARDALATAADLIDTHPATLRPDQYALALAWRIDALAHHHADLPRDTTVPEPPPEFDDDYHEPDDVPDPDAHQHVPETPDDLVALFTEIAAPAPLPPPPLSAAPPDPPAPVRPDPDEFEAVAALFTAGADRTARAALAALPEDQQRILRRIEATLRTYPFRIARAKLHAAARDNPEYHDLIRACTPDIDPGMYRPEPQPRARDRWIPPSRVRTRVDPSRRRRGRGHDPLTDHYFDENPDTRGDVTDDLYTPSEDEYGSGHIPVELWLPRDLSCVQCGMERPRTDSRQLRLAGDGIRDGGHDDGLCTGCRDEGAPGVTPHSSGNTLIARTEHILAHHPTEQAYALLQRDWRRLNWRQRSVMTEWMRNNDLLRSRPLIDTDNPLLLLTDTELAAAIDDTRASIALHANLEAAATPSSHPIRPPTAPLQQTAIEAIHIARQATAAVEALQGQIRSISAQASTTRTAQARARGRGEREELRIQLATLREIKQRLRSELDTARRDAAEAHRYATLLAGPKHRWDTPEVLLPSQPTPTPLSPAEVSEPPQDLQHRLAQLRGERQRRTALTERERAREERYRIEHSTPDLRATNAEPGTHSLHLPPQPGAGPEAGF